MARFAGDNLRVSQVFITSYTKLVSTRNAYNKARSVEVHVFDELQDARDLAEQLSANGTSWLTHSFPSITFASGESQVEVRDLSKVGATFDNEFISTLPVSSVELLFRQLQVRFTDDSALATHPAGAKLPARFPLASFCSGKRSDSGLLSWSLFSSDGAADIGPIGLAVARLTEYLAHTPPSLKY